ncbi:UNVERIFIED_CONTAM: hypothetical protein FKN15_051757 [Acipenser sinensis]
MKRLNSVIRSRMTCGVRRQRLTTASSGCILRLTMQSLLRLALLRRFSPVLNKSQVSPHQEVNRSSHPEANDSEGVWVYTALNYSLLQWFAPCKRRCKVVGCSAIAQVQGKILTSH